MPDRRVKADRRRPADVGPAAVVPKLSPREPDSHKGTYGRVLIVGGRRGMSGAVVLAGLAALRGGAGLVTVACPREIVDIVASAEPSYLTLPLPNDNDGSLVSAAADPILKQPTDVVAIGPGIGRSAAVAMLVTRLVDEHESPLVIDADALWHLADHLELVRHRTRPTVLTPHPGEFGRLIGLATREVQASRAELATRFAREHGVVLVLKGHGTVVTDGVQTAVNETGNPGMATGGSGDVLTGVVAALVAQKLGAYDAARLAVHLHGLAGDIAAEQFGQISMIASDLITALPDAFCRHQADA
jgi:NAD(P)H-hydrate epimerase